jgi:serine/threonine protein kinase
LEQKFDEADVQAAVGSDKVSYLGTGSFGETWRAVIGGRDAACKIIHKQGNGRERLEREIAGYRRVASPYVVTLYDARTISIAGEKKDMLVFEYIDGGDLRNLLDIRLPLPDELRGLALGLLYGLQALHGADLLHRDLKPANIALRDGYFGKPVILDLGLAKLLDIESITRYPQRVGTPMYMAPEQLKGERARRASDLWALGTVLYEATTGQHPFMTQGESLLIEELLNRFATPPEIPSDTLPDVAELISRCLSDRSHQRGTVAKAIKRMEEGGRA